MLANLRVDVFDHELVNTFDAGIAFFRRYVDDLLIILKRSLLDDVLSALNNMATFLKFELAAHGRSNVPYLDTSLSIDGD